MLELAVLLAGFALVPLDAEEPLPRLQFIMEAGRPRLWRGRLALLLLCFD